MRANAGDAAEDGKSRRQSGSNTTDGFTAIFPPAAKHKHAPQDEPDLFTHMEEKYLDGHAGQWQPSAAQAVIEVCQGCMQYDAHGRLTVKEALPRLLAACSASGVRVPDAAASVSVTSAGADTGVGAGAHIQPSASTSVDVD